MGDGFSHMVVKGLEASKMGNWNASEGEVVEAKTGGSQGRSKHINQRCCREEWNLREGESAAPGKTPQNTAVISLCDREG